MRLPLFIVAEVPAEGEALRLDGLRGSRAVRARQVHPGQTLLLGDGRGGTATAVVTASTGGRLDLVVGAHAAAPRPHPRLVVIQHVADPHRDALAVAELTELGADEIAPLAPEAVADRLEARGGARVAYWQALAREAAERSGRRWLPRIWPVYRAVTVLRRFQWGATGFVLDGTATADLSTVDIPQVGELVLVAGEQSILAAAEIAAVGYAVRVRRGEHVASSRSAAIAATATLAARLGRD
jgi:16S rRNA (uracil1498-N3)-methyltransferase